MGANKTKFSSLSATEKLRIANYGLWPDMAESMYLGQGGRCPICGLNIVRQRIHVDHDHVTGRVRGLLCKLCNLGLGSFKDNPIYLRNAASYLESTNPKLRTSRPAGRKKW